MADTNGPVTTDFPGVNPSSTPQVYGASAATISIPQVVPSSAELAVTESNLGTISFTTIIDVRQTAGSYPAINKNASFQKQVPVTPLGPQFTITPGTTSTMITPGIQGPPIAPLIQAIKPITPLVQAIKPITPLIQPIRPITPLIQPIAVQPITPSVQAIKPITPTFDIQPVTTTTEISTKQPIALYVTPETVGDITLPEPLS